MTMPMYFTNSRKVTLWFEGWESRTYGESDAGLTCEHRETN